MTLCHKDRHVLLLGCFLAFLSCIKRVGRALIEYPIPLLMTHGVFSTKTTLKFQAKYQIYLSLWMWHVLDLVQSQFLSSVLSVCRLSGTGISILHRVSHLASDAFPFFFFLASYPPIVIASLLCPFSVFWSVSHLHCSCCLQYIFSGLTVLCLVVLRCYHIIKPLLIFGALSHHQVLVDSWGVNTFLSPWILDMYILWTGRNSYCTILNPPLQKFQSTHL